MTVPIDDRGLTLGDGLFETVLAEDGTLRLWDEHLERLVRGCATLGLPAPDREALERAAQEALADVGLLGGRAAVRLSWTAGSGGRGLDRPATPEPRLIVQAAPAPLPSAPARLATVSIRRNATSPTSRLKTLAYLDPVMARREAILAGADEALMLDTHERVACAGAANVFWLAGGVLYTPALDCGVLDGIIRGRVIATSRYEVVETRAGRAALDDAEAIFLTNSLIGVRPVSSLDGRAIGGEVFASQIARVVL
jgi:branched-chain amino acid aminotransferase/4-amino-4-deoxychorismate lyase